MLLRQKPEGTYTYPEHRRGLNGKVRRLLWRLGFDSLTVYERLRQVETERDQYKTWLEAAESRAL